MLLTSPSEHFVPSFFKQSRDGWDAGFTSKF
jgi:hypothetical protein